MAECILLRASGGGIDPDELTARPEDVAQGKIFGGQGSDEPQKGILEVFSSPTVSYGAEDDPASGSVIVNQPEGIYKRSEGEYYCKIKVSYDDMISAVGLVSFPETETLFGVKGTLPDFTNQTLERDGNTANVKLINNFFKTDSGKGADVTIYLPRYGYYNETRITQAIYGIHPDVVQYGVPIGANPSGDGYHETGKFTGDATAIASQILKGQTAYVKGNKVIGTLAVNSALSFSIAAISGTEIEIYWTNPTTGPYSGVFIEMSTSGYPTAGNSTRVYTGLGTNRNPGGRSSCKISGLQPETKYYFTANSYCDGLPNGNAVNLTATTTSVGTRVFTSSQSWSIPQGVRKVDVFLVGGGCCGAKNKNDTENYIFDRCGGSSGKTVTYKDVDVSTINTVNIVIGSGANNVYNNNGGRSAFGYYEVSGGSMSELSNIDTGWNCGGSGGGDKANASVTSWTNIKAGDGGSNGSNGTTNISYSKPDKEYGKGQGTTTRAFGESNGTLYAGGGGGGGKSSRTKTESTRGAQGAGGSGGGGAGGDTIGGNNSPAPSEIYILNGQNATPNTGSGGGGAGQDAWSFRSNIGEWTVNNGTGGAGASGVVIVRWK